MTLQTTGVPSRRKQLATDFRKEFYLEFENAANSGDVEPAFTLHVADFEKFLVKYGHMKPISTTPGPMRTGGVTLRNHLRNELNDGSRQSLHGSPAYEIIVTKLGETLRVRLEVGVAANATPETMADIFRFSENKMKALAKDYELIKDMTLPTSIRERLDFQMSTFELCMSAMVKMLGDLSKNMDSTKALAYRAMQKQLT